MMVMDIEFVYVLVKEDPVCRVVCLITVSLLGCVSYWLIFSGQCIYSYLLFSFT